MRAHVRDTQMPTDLMLSDKILLSHCFNVPADTALPVGLHLIPCALFTGGPSKCLCNTRARLGAFRLRAPECARR
jgi:hypothetical protein